VILALAGLYGAARRRASWPLVIWSLAWAAVFLTNYNDHVRYLVPLSVLLAPIAGFAAEAMLLNNTSRGALLILLVLPLVQSVRLSWLLTREDTRAEAIERLYRVPGRVAIDVYGPDAALDHDSLERLSEWRGLYRREEHRRKTLAQGRRHPDGAGLDLVRVSDLFEFDSRTHSSSVRAGLEWLGDDPNKIFKRLGVTHILLVDRDPGDGIGPLLLDTRPTTDQSERLPILQIEAVPLFTVSPGEAGRGEARLPTELGFPLLSLWQVSRPGPRMALHRLDPR
jgi:hypothetical protein